jgi:hypothetical protein
VVNNKIKVEIKSKKEKSESDIKKRCHLFGHFKGKVFSEMQEFRKYLSRLSQNYGVNLKCLDYWRQEFQDTVWLLLTGMLLEKLEEPNDCLSRSPLMVIQEKESSLAGADGTDQADKPVISWYDPLKVNTVSSIYRYSQSEYDVNPMRISNPGKSVPRVNFSGLWLKRYGFEKGKKYEVYGFKNHLVLKIAECNSLIGFRVEDSKKPDKDRMVKDSSITIGRINS